MNAETMTFEDQKVASARATEDQAHKDYIASVRFTGLVAGGFVGLIVGVIVGNFL